VKILKIAGGVVFVTGASLLVISFSEGNFNIEDHIVDIALVVFGGILFFRTPKSFS
tara:strand:- start:848 stop:1015 length:168 start_codon:yes stop_codon:yes gene_type:complete